MVCKKCGQQIPADAVFCDFCGTKQDITRKKVFCGNCGAEIEEGDEFCGNCGQLTNGEPVFVKRSVAPKKKNKLAIITIVLSLVVLAVIAAIVSFMFINSSYKEEDQQVDSIVYKGNDGSDNDKDRGSQDAVPQDKKVNQTETPTQIPTEIIQPPVFLKATASSVRATDSEGGRYSVDAVLSTNNETKWVPSKSSNNGISEWIEVYTDKIQYVKGIEILNGYHKNREVWQNNNRVRACTITFSNGEKRDFILNDTMDMINLDLGKVIETTSIRLTITSVYSGNKWNDTAITYLGAY